MSAILENIRTTMRELGPLPPPSTIVVWSLAPEREALRVTIADRVYICVSRSAMAKLTAVAENVAPAVEPIVALSGGLLGIPVVEFEALPLSVQASLYLGLQQLRWDGHA